MMDPTRARKKETLSFSFSLLWPEGRKVETIRLGRQSLTDLGIDRLIQYLIIDRKRQEAIQEIFSNLCLDVSTIHYRLDVLDDLLRHEILIGCLQNLVPVISNLRYFAFRPDRDDWTFLQEVVWRLRELEHYVECVRQLADAFREIQDELQSTGLNQLRRMIEEIEGDVTFIRLKACLPELLSKINHLKSITIGINLNGGLVPCEATLLSINSRGYADDTLFHRIIGKEESRGIAPLHTSGDGEHYTNPLLVPLFKDLANILNSAAQPLSAALKQFISINSKLFVKLQDEFLFYLGATQIIRSMKDTGLPMCRPQVLEPEERVFMAKGLYNIHLAVQVKNRHTHGIVLDRPMDDDGERDLPDTVVGNDFRLDPDGRIAILTGPNRGGKTTFLQAIGLAQVLLQAGLYVPAEEARVSLCDNIFTHYPAQEEPEKGTGRFGEEALRLQAIFHTATRHSLILLNESLSSTSIGESLYLAQDLLRVLRMMGCRTVFTTHIHQLAADVERINSDTPGDSRLISLVATIEKVDGGSHALRPTFRIIPGPPEGHSYALELASRFGISKEQLLADLREQGRLPTR